MAAKEDKEDKEKAKSGGWFKALLGMIGGLLSGAVMMYVTPLVGICGIVREAAQAHRQLRGPGRRPQSPLPHSLDQRRRPLGFR